MYFFSHEPNEPPHVNVDRDNLKEFNMARLPIHPGEHIGARQ